MPNDLMVESFGAPGGADTHYGNQETVGCVDCGFSARTSQYATIEPMERVLPQVWSGRYQTWGFASRVSARIAVACGRDTMRLNGNQRRTECQTIRKTRRCVSAVCSTALRL